MADTIYVIKMKVKIADPANPEGVKCPLPRVKPGDKIGASLFPNPERVEHLQLKREI